MIIVESYSWHEITIALFSNSYDLIVQYLADLRETALKELDVLPTESLLASCLAGPARDQELREAHLFADSETTLGFDASLLSLKQIDRLAQIEESDCIELFSRWFVKPGHSAEANALLAPSREERLRMALGRGDLVEASLPNSTTRKELTHYIGRFHLHELENVVLHRYTVAMTPSLPLDRKPVPSTNHPNFTERIKNLRIEVERLRDLEDSLRSRGTPKILALRVLNMFANFNDGLLDRNLYPFFAELLPFMEDVLNHVARAARGYMGDVGAWCTDLQRITQNFELAYRNRFHNSHRLGEITDFNVDFKGGIQQLVTAFDGAFKAIASVVGNSHSFVSVSGEPGVFSTTYETRLNYFHVFQPEAFLTVAAHEAAWCCFKGTPTQMSAEVRKELVEVKNMLKAAVDIDARFWSELETDGLIGDRQSDHQQVAGERFLQTVVVDRLAFTLTYNWNVDLFWYWYLGYFHQLPSAYEAPLELSPRQSLDFVFRLATVCDITEDATLDRLLGPFAAGGIGRIYASKRDQLRHASEGLRKCAVFNAFRDRVWRFADSLLVAAFAECEGPTRREPMAIADYVTQTAAQYSQLLGAGMVVPFQTSDTFGPFRFCQSLFVAYLSAVKADFCSISGDNQNALLFRDIENGNRARQGGRSDVFAFDPLGGTFTSNPATRRRLFKLRSTLTMSLWDMALKTKRDLLAHRLTTGPFAAERASR